MIIRTRKIGGGLIEDAGYRHEVMLTPREARRRIYRHLRRYHRYTRRQARSVCDGYTESTVRTPSPDGEGVYEHPHLMDRHIAGLEGLYESVDRMVRRRRKYSTNEK